MRKPAPFILHRSTNTSGPHNDNHLHLCCIIYKTRRHRAAMVQASYTMPTHVRPRVYWLLLRVFAIIPW